MFSTILFVGFLRRTSNYVERITISDPNHMMSMIDHVTINVEILRIDSGALWRKFSLNSSE